VTRIQVPYAFEEEAVARHRVINSRAG
jgi:hypothetical protein